MEFEDLPEVGSRRFCLDSPQPVYRSNLCCTEYFLPNDDVRYVTCSLGQPLKSAFLIYDFVN